MQRSIEDDLWTPVTFHCAETIDVTMYGAGFLDIENKKIPATCAAGEGGMVEKSTNSRKGTRICRMYTQNCISRDSDESFPQFWKFAGRNLQIMRFPNLPSFTNKVNAST